MSKKDAYRLAISVTQHDLLLHTHTHTHAHSLSSLFLSLKTKHKHKTQTQNNPSDIIWHLDGDWF